MNASTSSEIDSLRARWTDADGATRRVQVLSERFNLASIFEVGEVAANETLSKDLRGIDFSTEKLSMFMVLEVDLSWANFASGEIDGPFQDSVITGCDFTAARIANTTFMACRGQGARFERALISDSTFEGSVLPGASFSGATLRGVGFLNSDLAGADFSQCSLHACHFRRVRLDARWQSVLAASGASLELIDWL